MRNILCLSALAVTLAAQAPPAPVTPDTVVAKVEGKNITVADLDRMLAGTPPVVTRTLRENPTEAIDAVFLTYYLAGEAVKLQLDQKSPWKDQIDEARQQVLWTAMTSHIADAYQVGEEQIDAYYKDHAADYKQVKIRAIKINFKPVTSTNPGDLAAAARSALEAAHAETGRTEAEAEKIAEEVVKQARAGTDFSKLVDKYAEGESKDFAGDYPPVKSNNYTPEIKKIVFAMKPGDTSDPIRQSNCFYVIRVAGESGQPLNDVREEIIHTLKQKHLGETMDALRERFKPQIVRPDYFLQLNAQQGAGKQTSK